MKTDSESTPDLSRLLARASERAGEQGAALLVTALREYAAREKLEWSALAARLHCDVDALNAIALCFPPREEYFVEDTKAIANGYTDWKVLLPLLRELQVLEGFSDPDSADTMLLAARDYEDDDDSNDDDSNDDNSNDDNSNDDEDSDDDNHHSSS